MTDEIAKSFAAPALSSLITDLDYRFALMSAKMQVLELEAARMLPANPQKAEILATIDSLKSTLKELSEILSDTADAWEILEGNKQYSDTSG